MPQLEKNFDTDVLVVGGGPAGLAAAIAARRKGMRVRVVDGAVPPIDKACGEGLMPDALKGLAEPGVRLPEGGGGVFRGMSPVSSVSIKAKVTVAAAATQYDIECQIVGAYV